MSDSDCPTAQPQQSTTENCYGECENAVWIYGNWEPVSLNQLFHI